MGPLSGSMLVFGSVCMYVSFFFFLSLSLSLYLDVICLGPICPPASKTMVGLAWILLNARWFGGPLNGLPL